MGAFRCIGCEKSGCEKSSMHCLSLSAPAGVDIRSPPPCWWLLSLVSRIAAFAEAAVALVVNHGVARGACRQLDAHLRGPAPRPTPAPVPSHGP